MDDLKLIYINKLGSNWQSKNLYEFIFSDDIKAVTDASDDWGWADYPASGNPEVPEIDYIKGVAELTTEIKFILIQESDTHSVWDSIDDAVALGFEDVSGYQHYPEPRLVFKFAESYKSVKDKLYSRDEHLKINEIKNGKLQRND
jgi:hypothetical protein